MAKSDFKPLSDALAKLNANRKIGAKTPKAKQPTPQMSLELWPDSVRGVPNAVLRGSLFTVNQRRSTAKKRELLAAVDGIEVRFKGERFNQTDLDVWEMLLHLARQQPLGDRVEFSAHAFLKELGRGTSGKHHEELKEEFARLLGGVVEITWTKEAKTFIGHLVEKAYRDEATQRYVVVFDSKMLSLYEGGYSHIDWQQRQALGKNNLAKWLHGFYASHAAPFPYKVETIKTLCGSKNGELRGFRRDLKAAFAELAEVGAIVSCEVDKSDLVNVIKIPTLSQQKNIKKRIK
jgi:hypothetical protein